MDEIAAGWLLVGGRVSTLDRRRPRVVDLRGATVVPGLVDTHAHRDPAERLCPRQPLRALTVGGARAMRADRERGVLAPGRQADRAVLEDDRATMRLEAVERLACRLTLAGGRIVHGGG